MSHTEANNIEKHPKIHENNPVNNWWLKGHQSTKCSGKYFDIARKIGTAYHRHDIPLFEEHYTNHYVNPTNDTIFIVAKSLDESIKNQFMTYLNPPQEVTILFRNSKYSMTEYEQIIKELVSKKEQLKQNNVTLQHLTVTVNGTLLLGIDNMTDTKIDVLAGTLKNSIDFDYLELYNSTKGGVDAGQKGENRPLVSGITIKADKDPGNGSMGFYVTWNNSNNHGVLTNHHVANQTGSIVYQPDTETSKYRIGETIEVSPTYDWALSDSALIELDEGIVGAPKIWNTSGPLTVDYVYDYWQISIGDNVIKAGAKTGVQSGNVTDKGSIIHPIYDNILIYQVSANYVRDVGDSGSPVYMVHPITGQIIGCGIHWGRSHGDPYFSALDMIEEDLGFDSGDFDFTEQIFPPWDDDFDDNSVNESIWKEIENEDGRVSEVGQELWLRTLSGYSQSQGGVISKCKYDIEGHSFGVNVTNFDSLDEVILFIGEDNSTASDPYSQSEWYRCLKTKYTAGDFDWYVQKKMDGSVTSIDRDSSSGSFLMKIAVDDGYILFYENNILRYVEEYDWNSQGTCALYTSTLSSRNSGVDTMDDFEYLDYDLTSDWYEPFDGAYTNNWTKISGTASVSGGKLNLTGSGNVVTKNTIGTNRYVKAEMNTLQNASNHWQVGWIQAKYEDWDNQIYGLLWPDGTVELAIRYNGNQNGWATSSGEISNPVGTAHTWEFTVSGDYVVLKIDGDIIFNEYHDNFGDIQGKVGLRADSTSVAEFDNIVIID